MIAPALLAQAEADAAKAIAAAGCDLRELAVTEEFDGLADLFVEIWGASEPLVSGELLRAMSKAGSYVVAAYVDGVMVGGCVGFHEQPVKRTLHSHIAGVRPELIGRRIGLALKLHQRVWALTRGITAIEWTYDPLVARNAYFNIVKLGARPIEYLTNFYGAMNDQINGADESDRILVRWELLDREGESLEPGEGSPATVVVALPQDIEGLRLTDPALAREWRLRVRADLAPLLAAGGHVIGFDREQGYLVQDPASPATAATPAISGEES